MGNRRLVSRKRMLIERMLKEGCSYLTLMKDLDECNRINGRNCKTMIHFLDEYSRCKAQNKECLIQSAELYTEMSDTTEDEDTWDEEETEEEEYPEMDEEIDIDDYDDSFPSPCADICCISNAVRRMSYTEVLVGRMLGLSKTLAGVQLYRYTRMRAGLKSYCKRARSTIKGAASVVRRLIGARNVELARKFKKKYNILRELLSDIEKRDAVLQYRFGR